MIPIIYKISLGFTYHIKSKTIPNLNNNGTPKGKISVPCLNRNLGAVIFVTSSVGGGI